MLNIDNEIFYKEPETLAEAKAQASNQKPYKPVSSNESYTRRIQTSRDMLRQGKSDFVDDNLAVRVGKVATSLGAGTFPQDKLGESNTFAEIVSDGVKPLCFSGINCSVSATVDGIPTTSVGLAPGASTIVLSITPDSGFMLDAVSCKGIPDYATWGANTVTFSMPSSRVDAVLVCLTDKCIAFTGGSDFTTLSLTAGASVEVSDDNSTWSTWDITNPYNVVNARVFVRAKTGSTSLYGFKGNFTTVSGRLISLVNYEATSPSVNDYQFTKQDAPEGNGLFTKCAKLKNIATLVFPDTTASYCYTSMFEDCDALTDVSVLPATEVKTYAYRRMFHNCDGLKSLPSNMLPGTMLYTGCYYHMFSSCNYLKYVPDLPSTSVPKEGYYYMFNYCFRLVGPINIYATNGFNTTENQVLAMFTRAGEYRSSMAYIHVKPYMPTQFDSNHGAAGVDSAKYTFVEDL